MKTYLITGSTSGIGKQITLELSTSSKVFAVYRNKNKVTDFEKNPSIKLINMDLSRPFEIDDQLKQINTKVDGLIYCAGIADNRPLKMSDPFFALNVFNVNYFSFIELMRLLVKNDLLNADSSNVVISSVTSVVGEKGKSIYSGSKGALESSIRSMVKELSGKGHRINIIRAGMVETEIYEQYINDLGEEFKRNILSKQFLGIISKSDVINVIKFLLSDSSSKINGATINLDGGSLI